MKIHKNNLVRLVVISIFVLALFTCLQAQTKKKKYPRWNWEKHQTVVINYAKKYLVSEIEPNLPQISFADWLQQTVGKDAKIEWDVNDCGEQTGTPEDRGRDFPMCVAANTVKAGYIYFSVNIQFGTFGRKSLTMKPVVRSITAGDEIGGEWLDNLGDVPKYLESHNKTPAYLNPNGGVFKFSNNPPVEFKNIDGILIQSVNFNPGKYIWAALAGEIVVGQTPYKFQSFMVDRQYWKFETSKIGGVSFKFEGEFAKLKLDSNGEVSGDNVLHGHLIKFVRGKKAEEADLFFNFYETGNAG